MGQGEIRAWSPFGGDNPLRKKVPDALSRWRRVSGEEVIEAPVFANDDNHMFNRVSVSSAWTGVENPEKANKLAAAPAVARLRIEPCRHDVRMG